MYILCIYLKKINKVICYFKFKFSPLYLWCYFVFKIICLSLELWVYSEPYQIWFLKINLNFEDCDLNQKLNSQRWSHPPGI